MNSFAFPAVLLLACVHAGADVVIEQKTEFPNRSGITRMKIKGDRARIDMPSAAGDVTVFLDKTGNMATYLHQSKLVLNTTMTETQIQAKALIAQAGVEPRKPDPMKPTGETEKVGDWNCEIWERFTPAVTHKEWRTKDVPNLARIREQMKVVASVSGIDIGQPEASDFFTVKNERSDTKGTITTTVVKVSEEAVPESDFTPPAGYRDVTPPAK
jgi:hypothetical protein